MKFLYKAFLIFAFFISVGGSFIWQIAEVFGYMPTADQRGVSVIVRAIYFLTAVVAVGFLWACEKEK